MNNKVILIVKGSAKPATEIPEFCLFREFEDIIFPSEVEKDEHLGKTEPVLSTYQPRTIYISMQQFLKQDLADVGKDRPAISSLYKLPT